MMRRSWVCSSREIAEINQPVANGCIQERPGGCQMQSIIIFKITVKNHTVLSIKIASINTHRVDMF